MSSQEFGKWLAFSSFHPFGHFRTDLQVANILSTLYALLVGKEVPPSSLVVDYEARVRPEVEAPLIDGEAFVRSIVNRRR